MIIHIPDIPEGHSVRNASVKINVDEVAEVHWLDIVQCSAEIDRVGNRFQVRIAFSSTLELQCSRCLNYFKQPVTGMVSVVFESREGQTFTNLSEDEYCTIEYNPERQEVDITPALFDEIITGLSMKPLCSQSCPGPEIEGKKETDEIDPRWNQLKKLKEKYNSQ
ncbi:MAG: hypothetical protein GF401_13085 [Chitinivibrionales bacterium]|nr:hypothetical protein [Chitinivibrionales bacterium]